MKKYSTKILIILGVVTASCIFIESPYIIASRTIMNEYNAKQFEERRKEWIDENQKEIREYLDSKNK